MQRSDIKRNAPSPQRENQEDANTQKTPPPRTIPTRHLDRQWSACSLCSVDSIELDEQLPIPGRESHTSDMNQFLTYIHRLNRIQRFQGDKPLNLEFWKFIKDVLETAKNPVGYTGLQDCDAVETKSAQDNAAFLRKIDTTSIINPMDPVQIADQLNLTVNDVLTELLYAAKIDMVRMRWFPDCEIPGTETCASKRPRKKATYCHACKYRNAIAVLQKIKVVFCFNTDIFFALAETTDHFSGALSSEEEHDLLAVAPASFTGSGYRYSVGCGGDNMLRPALEPGRYRIQCPIAMTSSSCLHVARAATPDDAPHVLRIHVSDMLHRTGRSRKPLLAPHGKIQLDIFTDTHPFFICQMNRVVDEEVLSDDGLATEPAPALPISKSNNNNIHTKSKRPFTSAQTLMNNSAYLNLFESTEDETFHFNSAVKKMSLDAGDPISDLMAPMKGLSCCVSDEISSVAEDEGSLLPTC